MTATKTKTNGRQVDPRTARTIALELGDQIVRLPIEQIALHPHNPGRHRITKQNTRELADSLKANGLQQPILVRSIESRPPSRFAYQLIFGERRLKAAKLLKWDQIDARLTSEDDATTGRLQATENGQREDLDPIAIAEHLQRLTTEQADGSEPLTQAAAGACYNLKTQGAVSNVIRLLKLPNEIRELIRSQEMTTKIGRALVPFCHAQRLVQVFLQDWREPFQRKNHWQGGDRRLDEHLIRLVVKHVRPVKKTQRHDYGWPDGPHPRYFEIDAELRPKLEIKELPIGKRPGKGQPRATVEAITNVGLFDKLNRPLMEKNKLKKKSIAARRDRQAKPVNEMSPKELQHHKRKATEKRRMELADKDAELRRRLLRLAISAALKAGDWRTTLVATYAQQAIAGAARLSGIYAELLAVACWEAAGKKNRGSFSEDWCTLAGNSGTLNLLINTAEGPEPIAGGIDQVSQASMIELNTARLALWPVSHLGWPETGTPRRWLCVKTPSYGHALPPLHWGAIDRLADDLFGLDLAKQWKTGAIKGRPQRDLIEQFLSYRRKAELVELASELRIKEVGATNHGGLVAFILAQHTSDSPLPLPAALKPPRKRK